MEMEFVNLINAISDLSNVIESQSKIGILSFVFSVLASVFSVAIVDCLRLYLNKPYKEFMELRSKINKGLKMYACYLSNPINNFEISEKERQLYWEASYELRKLSVDLSNFECMLNRKKIGGVQKATLEEVSDLLMLLSNSMYNSNPKENHDHKLTILRLLKIKD